MGIYFDAVRSVYGLELGERHAVPYADGRIGGFLPAYRLKPPRPKCTIVFFGGFDSYIEERTSAFIYLRDAGYDVIAFDGPCQVGNYGLALRTIVNWLDEMPVGKAEALFTTSRVPVCTRAARLQGSARTAGAQAALGISA